MKKHITLYYIRSLITIILLYISSEVCSQSYPVIVNSFFTPPYSTQIGDYAVNTENKFTLQLLLKDINENNRQVKLKLYIEGNGLKVQSTDFVAGATSIYLNGGVMQQFTNVDLRSYFRLENLNGISASQYSNPLPDGIYTFFWEVYDFNSNQRISLKSGMPIYLAQNEPPLLNLPLKNETIAQRDPVNIIFQWVPRQINATNVDYLFELKEIWDEGIDPQAAFLASPTFYSEETYATTLIYNMGNPALIPGKMYAWRVQARSKTGLTQNNIFKNNGYSEIYYFRYNSDCGAPMFAITEAINTQTVRIQWQGMTGHNKYHVQYRKKGVANAQWFEVFTVNNQVQVGNLEAGSVYEYRVGGTCAPLSNLSQTYTYNEANEFTMPEQGSANTYNCGINPDVKITNTNPISDIAVDESFTAGDFTIVVKEITNNGGGSFTGKGYIKVPYLSSIKIAVEFNSVKINTSNELFEGKVETSYDANWGSMTDVGTATGEGSENYKDISIKFPIKEIIVDEDGQITIVGSDNETVEYPGGKDYTFVDENGKVWTVDKNGAVTSGGETVEGGKSTSKNTDGVDSSGNVTAITAKDVVVTFEENNKSKYAFDAANSSGKKYPEYVLKEYYTSLAGGYYVPYKAVKYNETDVLTAKVKITDSNISIDSLIFKTKEGEKIETSKVSSNELILTVKGTFDYALQEIQAVIKQGEKYKIAGAFKLVHFSDKEAVKVIMVNMGGTMPDKNELETHLNKIYNKAGAHFQIGNTIEINPDIIPGNVIKSEKTGLTAQYTEDQRIIHNAIKSVNGFDKTAYYVIVTDKKSSSKEDGFMPLGRQFGYIFSGGQHTIAHELGHGVFAFKHPSSKEGESPEKKTDLLMDYGDGTKLSFKDWDAIQNPKFRIGWFDSHEEGQAAVDNYIVTKEDAFFVAPNGRPIFLPKGSRVYFPCDELNLADGYLHLFACQYNGEYKHFYAEGWMSGIFEGYNRYRINGNKKEKYINTDGFGEFLPFEDVLYNHLSGNKEVVYIQKKSIAEGNKHKLYKVTKKFSNIDYSKDKTSIDFWKVAALEKLWDQSNEFNVSCNNVPEGSKSDQDGAQGTNEKKDTENVYSSSFFEIDGLAVPPGVSINITNSDKLSPEQVSKSVNQLNQLISKNNSNYSYSLDMTDNDLGHMSLGNVVSGNKNLYGLDHRLVYLSKYSTEKGDPINIYVVYTKIDYLIDGNWNDYAKQTYENSNLKGQAAIVITVPYFEIEHTNIYKFSTAHFMPGVYTSGPEIYLQAVGKIKARNVLRGGTTYYETIQSDQVEEFIEKIYTQTFKPYTIYLGLRYADGTIEPIKKESRENVAGFNFVKKVILKNNAYYNRIKALSIPSAQILASSSTQSYKENPNYEFELLDYEIKKAELLDAAANSNNESDWVNYESSIDFKEKQLDDITANKYITGYAFKDETSQWFEDLKVLYSNVNENPPVYQFDQTYNRDKWSTVDPIVYNTLDVSSTVLSFVGADAIPDAVGLMYSLARQDALNTGMYSSAVLFPVVSRGGLKILLQKTTTKLTKDTRMLFRGLMYSVTAEGKLTKISSAYTHGRILDFFKLSNKSGSLPVAEVNEFIKAFKVEKRIKNQDITDILKEKSETKRLEKFRELIRKPTEGVTNPTKNYKTTSMLPNYKGEDSRANSPVKYLTQAERNELKVTIKNGKMYKANGEPLTARMSEPAIYVMDKEGNIYVSTYSGRGEYHHSTILAGQPIAAAGQIEAENGVITSIDNLSGHYVPNPELNQQVIDELKSRGANLTDAYIDFKSDY